MTMHSVPISNFEFSFYISKYMYMYIRHINSDIPERISFNFFIYLYVCTSKTKKKYLNSLNETINFNSFL